jgi:hypothetical protein
MRKKEKWPRKYITIGTKKQELEGGGMSRGVQARPGVSGLNDTHV